MPRGRWPIGLDMSVSAVTPESISNQSQANAAAERAVLVLKKQQDVAEAQAAALISLIQAVPVPSAEGVGTRINTYA